MKAAQCVLAVCGQMDWWQIVKNAIRRSPLHLRSAAAFGTSVASVLSKGSSCSPEVPVLTSSSHCHCPEAIEVTDVVQTLNKTWVVLIGT